MPHLLVEDPSESSHESPSSDAGSDPGKHHPETLALTDGNERPQVASCLV